MGSKVIAFFYLLVCTRMFSQEALGNFNLALGIVSICLVFADLGLVNAFYRYVPHYLAKGLKKEAGALLAGTFMVVILFSAVCMLVFMLLAPSIASTYSNPNLAPVIVLLALFVPLNSIIGLAGGVIVSLKKMMELAAVQNIQSVVKIALTIAAAFAIGASAISVSAGYVLSFVATAAIALIMAFRMLSKEGITFFGHSQEDMRKQVGEALPFGMIISLITGVWIIISSSDRILLGYLANYPNVPDMIAIYSMATTLATILLVFTGAIGNVFLPVISGQHAKEQEDQLCRTANAAERWMLIAMVPALCIMLAYPSWMLGMLYGDSYSPGAMVLVIFSIGMFVRGLSMVHSYVIAAYKRLKAELAITAGGAVMNVVLNVLLIPGYGMEGAAAASAASFLMISILLFIYTKNLLRTSLLRASVKPLFLAIVPLAVLLVAQHFIPVPQLPAFLPQGAYFNKVFELAFLGVLFALACASYFLALALFRAFGKEDLDVLSSLMRRLRVPAPYVVMLEKMLGA
jgi:O-antigen/teichoic acid export membrane protein